MKERVKQTNKQIHANACAHTHTHTASKKSCQRPINWTELVPDRISSFANPQPRVFDRCKNRPNVGHTQTRASAYLGPIWMRVWANERAKERESERNEMKRTIWSARASAGWWLFINRLYKCSFDRKLPIKISRWIPPMWSIWSSHSLICCRCCCCWCCCEFFFTLSHSDFGREIQCWKY